MSGLDALLVLVIAVGVTALTVLALRYGPL